MKTDGLWYCIDYKDCPGHKDTDSLCRPMPQSPPQGTKYDDGKPPLALLDTLALVEVAKVLAFGAKKYAPDNWRKGFAWRRLISAALRHLLAFAAGEDLDPETQISHVAHAMCCLMFLLNHQLTKLGTDDRWKPAPITEASHG